jgi:hypothetical protein
MGLSELALMVGSTACACEFVHRFLVKLAHGTISVWERANLKISYEHSGEVAEMR